MSGPNSYVVADMATGGVLYLARQELNPFHSVGVSSGVDNNCVFSHCISFSFLEQSLE